MSGSSGSGGSRVHRAARSGLALAVLILLAACGPSDAVRDGSGQVVAAGPWSVFDLRPGDCIGDTSDAAGDTEDVPLVPCAAPHSMEVFAVIRHPEDAYPGAGAVATFADRACLTALDAELDLSIEDGIAFSYLLPTVEGWNEDGDRNVVCVLVFAEEAGMVGSFVTGTAVR